MTRPLPGQAPLIGRTAELRQLENLAGSLIDGAGWFATVSGGAGVGKSRLTAEFMAGIAARGVRVLLGYCDEDTRQNPFGPFVEALRSSSHSGQRTTLDSLDRFISPSLTPLFPHLRTGGDEMGPPDRSLVADGLLHSLELLAGECPTVLVIEDLQLATRATLGVLRQLSPRMHSVPCGLLVTWRTDDPESEQVVRAFETNTQIRQSITARIQLGALSWAEVRQFVGVLLGGESLPPTALIDRLYERTEGNPFYIEEIVHALEATDDLHDYARLADQLPSTLGGVLRQRLQKVGAQGEQVLGAAAVFGRRFSAEALTEIASLDRATVERSLQAALRHEVVAESGRSFVFRHALLQETAMSGLVGPERRRLHLRIAHALERDPSATVGRSAALAHHYGQADDREAQRLHAELAGDEAVSRDDLREATAWYIEALRLQAELGEPEPLVLLEKSAQLFVRNWRLADAERAYDRLIAARRTFGDSRALGETLVASAMVYFNDAPKRLARLREAFETLQLLGPSDALARAQIGLASIYLNVDHPDALDYAIAALPIAISTNARDAEAIALRVIGTYACQSHIELGARLLRTSIKLSVELGMNADAYLASFNLAGGFLRAGRWREAEAALRPGYDAAVRQNVPDGIGTSLIRLAQIRRLSGEWLAADELVAQARLRIDETDVSARMLFAFEAAYLDVARGKWDAVISGIEPMCAEIDRKEQMLDVATAHELMARARLGSGDVAGAVAEARRMLSALKDLNSYSAVPFFKTASYIFGTATLGDDLRATAKQLTSLHRGLQVLLEPAALRERLPAIYRGPDLPDDLAPGPLLGRVADAVIHGCEAMIAEVEGRFVEAANAWSEALTFWSTAGQPYEEAQCKAQLGACLLRAGRDAREAAREHLIQAREIFARLGAVDVRQVDMLLRKHRLEAPPRGRASGLTTREREIAELIAGGMSNREIAEALVLSPKTVEHHVGRMLTRLDLTGRAAIAAYVSGLGSSQRPPEART